MSHAAHFLERLERLSPAQTDMALTLYRDPGLVGYILGRIRLPEGSERVAMALEDGPDAPHIVVTRDGAFVTCLAPGMSLGALPVVSRHATENLSEKIAAVRSALQRDESETKGIYKRLFGGGLRFSREDFETLRDLMPIVAIDMVGLADGFANDVVSEAVVLGDERRAKLTGPMREELHRLWTATCGLGHLVTLLVERQDDVNAFSVKGTLLGDAALERLILATTMVGTDSPTFYRGARALACAGPRYLSLAAERLDAAMGFRPMASAAIGLSGIGLRYPRKKDEVTRRLTQYRDRIASVDVEVVGTILQSLDQVIGHLDPEGLAVARKKHRDLGAQLLVDESAELSLAAPFRFTDPEEVPDDLAAAFLLHRHGQILPVAEDIEVTSVMGAWAVTADAASLYLPKQILDRLAFPFDPALLALDLRAANLGREPVRKQPVPGRNDPCSCGSGKKYKRCCGAVS